jgi:enoyl-CoA hydratase/carnithine racemase
MSAAIKLQINDYIALLTMNKLPANIWTRDSLEALISIVNDLNQRRDIYSLVLV